MYSAAYTMFGSFLRTRTLECSLLTSLLNLSFIFKLWAPELEMDMSIYGCLERLCCYVFYYENILCLCEKLNFSQAYNINSIDLKQKCSGNKNLLYGNLQPNYDNVFVYDVEWFCCNQLQQSSRRIYHSCCLMDQSDSRESPPTTIGDNVNQFH